MTEQTVLSVSQLNRQAKRLLQTQLGMLWVKGEISSFSRPASGHWYFTLKDEQAQIRCAMFRGRNQLLKYHPKEGDEVILRGSVGLYEPRGDYQLIAEHMEAEGEGRLRQAFEALKKQLLAEGLFAQEHKKSLPTLPKHIAVITSSSGAAVHDICSTLKRRWPSCEISILPSLVQGAEAPKTIVNNITLANQSTHSFEHPIEAIIVGRGGGSIEDLQAFNEESVARAIFNSELPIVSAVGHETDFTIADFVADARAATPTAAAELLSPDQLELQQQFDYMEQQLNKACYYQLEIATQSFQTLKRALQHPLEKIKHYQINFQQLYQRLLLLVEINLASAKQELSAQTFSLKHANPLQDITLKNSELKQLAEQLGNASQSLIQNKQNQLENSAALLNTLSPLATIGRGYSLTTDKKQKVITSTNSVKVDENIYTQVEDGIIESKVTNIQPKN